MYKETTSDHAAAERPPAIALSRVSQLFGTFVALHDLSLELPMGSSAMLLGPNGAGKSTLLRLIAGLTRPSYGEVHVFGTAPSELRGRIAYMSHSTMLYDELTGPENLDYLLSLQRPDLTTADRRRRVAEELAAVGLGDAMARRLGEYSQGMRQRASLARVLLAQPDLLLLDEPFSNLDAASVQALIQRLDDYLAPSSATATPRTLVLTTHQPELARALVTRVLTLGAGRLLNSSGGTPTLAKPAAPAAGAFSI